MTEKCPSCHYLAGITGLLAWYSVWLKSDLHAIISLASLGSWLSTVCDWKVPYMPLSRWRYCAPGLVQCMTEKCPSCHYLGGITGLLAWYSVWLKSALHAIISLSLLDSWLGTLLYVYSSQRSFVDVDLLPFHSDKPSSGVISSQANLACPASLGKCILATTSPT